MFKYVKIGKHIEYECAKFIGSSAIVGLVGLVPSCHRVFVGISWVQIFSRGYFVGPIFFFSRLISSFKDFKLLAA